MKAFPKILQFLTVTSFIFLSSCQHENAFPRLPNISSYAKEINKNLYFAGTHNIGTTSAAAAYWKNGEVTNLTNGTTEAFVSSMTISGSDIYVSGYESPSIYSSVTIAKYWKNGAQVKLTDGSHAATALSIFISGSDIFVCGSEKTGTNGKYDVAKYWKNGIPVELTDGTSDAYALKIVILGEDIHVIGVSNNVPTYWKNGVATTFAAFLTDMVISDNDVYILGEESNGANSVVKYWKNGTAVQLTDGTNKAGAQSIIVAGSDVYVGGFEIVGGYKNATYWKNGQKIKLSTVDNNTEICPMAVSGSDLYLATWEYGNYDAINLWKNGTQVATGNGIATIMAICID